MSTEYPADDPQFDEWRIDSVIGDTAKGWQIGNDGMCFWCPAESPVKPQVGMTARLYGKGFGYEVRGLFIDGRRVFYRTETEQAEYADICSYGKDAADLLDRWDNGQSVFSVEMGGLGPGYEQAIQVTAFEILRHLLTTQYVTEEWREPETWKRDRDAIDAAVQPVVASIGLSGAQWGAAMSLATTIYAQGPRKALKSVDRDRLIQVSREPFPIIPLPTLATGES